MHQARLHREAQYAASKEEDWAHALRREAALHRWGRGRGRGGGGQQDPVVGGQVGAGAGQAGDGREGQGGGGWSGVPWRQRTRGVAGRWPRHHAKTARWRVPGAVLLQ